MSSAGALFSEKIDENDHGKKRKLSENGEEKQIENLHLGIDSFKGFELKRVLNEDIASKTIFVEGTFNSSSDSAVVILEKKVFGKDAVADLLTGDTVLISKFNNNIYSSFKCIPKPEFNDLKATLIYPCTEKHIEKYQFHPHVLVAETPKLYTEVVLPHLMSQQFSIQWVYNILEHKSEAERIVFEDPDPELGFILLPDLKWDESNTSNLYVLSICHKRGLKSLRDLTADHLPILENIYSKSCEAIYSKYGVPKHKIRAYFHYQPSYYHLHIHFSSIDFSNPGTYAGKAHLFEHVVNNLKLMSDYYQKSTLMYSVKENDPLYVKLNDAGTFK